MCYVCWSVNTLGLQASTATPAAALGDPPRQDILNPQPPALLLSVLSLSPISACSRYLSLAPPSSLLVINHLPAGGGKNKQYPLQDTRGDFRVVATTLQLFNNILSPAGGFSPP